MTRENDQKQPLSDALLQRYFDDELAPSERTAVEARLDGEARLRLEALGELRSLLRGHVDAEARGVDFSATFDAIAKTGTSVTASPRRRVWLPLTAASGLLAAVLALAVIWRPATTTVAPVAAQSNAAEVETLEVSGAVASIFTVGDDDPATHATVIWANDDDEPLADDHDNEEKE